MCTIEVGEQVVSMASNGETIEVYTVFKVLSDEVQVDGTSGKLTKTELRAYSADTVKRIREKESQLKTIKREIKSLYDTLSGIE